MKNMKSETQTEEIFVRAFAREIMFLNEHHLYINDSIAEKLNDIAASDGIHIEEIDSGTEYDTGMSVNPLNIEDFSADDSLQIEQMIEPIIMKDASLVRTGTVILRRADE